jgi:ribosomal protein S18 acetylase RimI-like enzyme
MPTTWKMGNRRLSVVALTPQVERAAGSFSCGVRRIDDYLRQGLTLQEHNLARLFVALEPPKKAAVIGYYAMHNMHIEAAALPPPGGMSLRRDAVVGAVYVVMFAVDKQHQNRGVGTALFANALRRVKRISAETGTAVVVLEALNERAEAFYRRFGFETLVSGTRRLFLPVGEIA